MTRIAARGLVPLLLGIVFLLAACTGQSEPRVLRLVTHDSFDVNEEVIAAFEEANNVTVEFVTIGDAGAMVNQSILAVNNPLGDLLFGVDNTFLGRALDADIFEPYRSANIDQVPDAFRLDPQDRVTPIDFGDVCLNFDRAYFQQAGLAPPGSLEDLIDPAYRGLTVVENPATSSPGMAFLLATVESFGEEGWEEYWQALRANDVFVTSGWSEAYFDQFSGGGADGRYPIVVSYASSPPFTEGATGTVTADRSCFRQIEFAGILKNGMRPTLARRFIDFMLTRPFQDGLSESMFVFPVVDGATVSAAFEQWAEIPAQPAILDPATIESGRDRWIERWTEIVLR